MLHGRARRRAVARALLPATAVFDAGLVFTSLILDGHNDVALRRWRGEPLRHLDLEHPGDFAGGFFALFVPSPRRTLDDPEPPYALPLDAPVDREDAARVAREQASVLEGLGVAIAGRVEDFAPGRVTAIMHLEGADPLAPDLSDLDEWYERGLRSIGLTWSRPNAFADGVPFEFPASGNPGRGLTDAGRRLVEACNERGILVDLSHLSPAGFWDVAELSDAPLVATHSNALALCASSRNLTDEQLDAVGESGGVVGVNFGNQFLRRDGRPDSSTPVADIVAHIDYIAGR
ncbi:MAG: dipeptidase, partial [Actinobacteria bacterium]|nr:dipeptidase [Actinomycetota bacterium]